MLSSLPWKAECLTFTIRNYIQENCLAIFRIMASRSTAVYAAAKNPLAGNLRNFHYWTASNNFRPSMWQWFKNEVRSPLFSNGSFIDLSWFFALDLSRTQFSSILQRIKQKSQVAGSSAWKGNSSQKSFTLIITSCLLAFGSPQLVCQEKGICGMVNGSRVYVLYITVNYGDYTKPCLW